MDVDEYQIGQLYSCAEASIAETGGGEGIEVVKNDSFKNIPLLGGKYTTGQYTFKVTRFYLYVKNFQYSVEFFRRNFIWPVKYQKS